MKRRGHRDKEKIFFLSMILLFLFSSSALIYYKNYIKAGEEYVVVDISSVQLDGGTAMVILRGGCREFSFSIPKAQGESLLYLISKYNSSGTRTMPSGIGGLQSTMRLVQGSPEFYGELIVQDMLSVKTGLAEAIALAIETRIPIIIKRGLTEKIC